MNVAIYYCQNHDALSELLGNLDRGESMDVTATRNGYIVAYKSSHLMSVATDPDINGCVLVSQHRAE